MWVGAEGGAPAPPSRPSIRPRALCHWPWRPGGREDDISGRLDYKGTSRATDSERTQPAPCSSGTRARLASLLRIRLSDCSPAVPAADRLHPRSHRHHAPLPADRLCPAANATLTPALRGQARDATEGGCCCGDTWFVRGVGGCGTQEMQTLQTCAYKARTSLIHSSASGKYHAHLQCPQCAQQDKRHGKGKGLPEGAGARAAWQVDAGLSCSHQWGRAHGWGGPLHSGARRSHLRYIRVLFHLPTLFPYRAREPLQGRSWRSPRQLVAIRKRVTRLQAAGAPISRETDRDCSGTCAWTPSPGLPGPAFCTSTPTRANTKAATRRACPKAALASSWTGSAP